MKEFTYKYRAIDEVRFGPHYPYSCFQPKIKDHFGNEVHILELNITQCRNPFLMPLSAWEKSMASFTYMDGLKGLPKNVDWLNT
jgi:hypothetical protein